VSNSDGVEEANNVRVRRLKLVPWSDWLEPKKKEVADDVFVVMMELIKASHHMGDSQLLLRILQQGHESTLATVSQLATGNAHVQPLLPENSIPASADTAQPGSREANLNCRVLGVVQILVASFACVGVQSIAHRVRGIFSIPRASALWEIPTCAGNIKPAVEAPRRERRRRPWPGWSGYPCRTKPPWVHLLTLKVYFRFHSFSAWSSAWRSN